MRLRHRRNIICFLAALCTLNPFIFSYAEEEQALTEEELLKEISPWTSTFNVRGGAGFRDNVLLGAFQEQDSFFWNTQLESMFWRIPIDGTEVYTLLSASDTRFLEDVDVDKEQTLFLLNQVKHEWNERWTAGAELQYYYLDQVLDVSTLESENLNALPLKAHTLTFQPMVERKLTSRWSLMMAGVVDRQFFSDPLDDYWEWGPLLEATLDYGHRSEFTVSYEFAHRLHDTREKVSRTGFRIPGSRLEYYQNEIEFGLKHYWDKERKWRTWTKAGYERNDDNGSGYYDLNRFKFRQEVRYREKNWEISSRASLLYYDYDHQQVSRTDPSSRYKTGLVLSIKGERNITEEFKLFCEVEHEKSLSNRQSNEYDATKFLAGIDLEF